MENDDGMRQRKLLLRLQYFWRLAIPFWIFRDASRGTLEQRIANYRYNRSQRKVLPFYMMKWLGIAACLMQMTQVLSDVTLLTVTGSSNHLCAALLCMTTGIGFAFSCVVIAILCSSYLFLTWIKK